MSGLLGAESTLGDLDAVLIELIDAGELRCGVAADGALRFEPAVHARAGSGEEAAGRPVVCERGGRGWVERLGGRAAGPSRESGASG